MQDAATIKHQRDVFTLDNTSTLAKLSSMEEPLSADAARALIHSIRREGIVAFSGHADQEMAKDNLTKVDIANILRGGVVGEGEWENGSWRYHVYTQRMTVVVAFRSETQLVVVTAWRNGK